MTEEEEADLAELTQTIRGLIEIYNEAPEGSASYRLAERALAGLAGTREMAQPIMEDFGLWINAHPPAAKETEPGQILPLSRRPRRTSE